MSLINLSCRGRAAQGDGRLPMEAGVPDWHGGRGDGVGTELWERPRSPPWTPKEKDDARKIADVVGMEMSEQYRLHTGEVQSVSKKLRADPRRQSMTKIR